MSNSVAEAYLLMLRPSMIPIIGEAVPIPFNEQIEIDEWHWELKHDEKAAGGKGATSSPPPSSSDEKSPFDGKSLIAAVTKLQNAERVPQEERNKKVRDLIKKTADAQAKTDKDRQSAEDDKEKDKDTSSEEGDNPLAFTFTKSVDAATTQLLNAMKAGQPMPRAILTLFHRSVNAPVTFIVKFESVMLTNYALSVDTRETMSDLNETWTCTFKAVEYTYQNRPAASGPNGITKGTVRVFKMSKGSLI